MHSKLLCHAVIHTFIFLLIILLIHSRAFQPANIQSCFPGFLVMHLSTHSSFYSLFYSFIHVHTNLPISSHGFQVFQSCIYLHIHTSSHSFIYSAYQTPNIQSCIPGFSVMHLSTQSFFFSFVHFHMHTYTHYLLIQSGTHSLTNSFISLQGCIPAYQ
jgi:hypothetical protein